ncbi:MAG: bifunctional nuclease domain-containing protein, partial [Thermoleophilia bacterium]
REPWDQGFEMTAPCVVLLREAGGDRLLPIWIGEPEAAALVMHRQGTKVARPLSPDLAVALLGAVEARVERVVVERVRDNTFFATVTVTAGGEPHEVDARPSDALNLALRSQAPIHIAAEIIETSGITAWHGAPDDDETAPPWTPMGPGHARSRMPPRTVGEDSPPTLRRAAEEARRIGHGWVGSAHLLLGILADPDTAVAEMLARHGLTCAAARTAAEQMFTDHPMPPPGKTTFLTPHATIAVRRARTAARRGGGNEDDPAQLLLALIDNSGAATLLNGGDVDLSALRSELLAALEP